MIQTENPDDAWSRRPQSDISPSRPATTPYTAKSPEALLTRRELADYITNELGRPISFSTLTKLCALREGPPVHEWWSRFPLYRREDGKAWADARARKPEVSKDASRS
jgi:hypothetical protein